MNEVEILPSRPDGVFEEIVDREYAADFVRTLDLARDELAGKTMWHINSTATGGGVAEILQSVLSYVVGGGIHVRWLTIDADEPFFEATKRLHHFLHGMPGDGGELSDAEVRIYETSLAPEIEKIEELVRAGDVVVLHDPQTLGLAPALRASGAIVAWNCHIGADEPNELTRRAWAFLDPYVRETSAQIFSRRQYVWESLDSDRVAIIPPCIDAFSPKNRPLNDGQVAAILAQTGIEQSTDVDAGEGVPFLGESPIESLLSPAEMIEEEAIERGTPLVVQISRWDPLKDHEGVMRGFVAGVPEESGAHLMLVGPAADEVSDDPEGPENWEILKEAWRRLPVRERQRVHLASLPTEDIEQNALIVNAVQRRASLIVQKSLAEGFGLTVTEAMWKARPVVASRVGGIQDQIEHGSNGMLVDPRDPVELGRAITHLLADPVEAARIGKAAHRRVLQEYLAPCYLARHLSLASALLRQVAGERS